MTPTREQILCGDPEKKKMLPGRFHLSGAGLSLTTTEFSALAKQRKLSQSNQGITFLSDTYSSYYLKLILQSQITRNHWLLMQNTTQ